VPRRGTRRNRQRGSLWGPDGITRGKTIPAAGVYGLLETGEFQGGKEMRVEGKRDSYGGMAVASVKGGVLLNFSTVEEESHRCA